MTVSEQQQCLQDKISLQTIVIWLLVAVEAVATLITLVLYAIDVFDQRLALLIAACVVVLHIVIVGSLMHERRQLQAELKHAHKKGGRNDIQ